MNEVMLMSRIALSVLPVVVAIFQAGAAAGQITLTGSGQAYPNKPIRMVTTVLLPGLPLGIRVGFARI